MLVRAEVEWRVLTRSRVSGDEERYGGMAYADEEGGMLASWSELSRKSVYMGGRSVSKRFDADLRTCGGRCVPNVGTGTARAAWPVVRGP